MNQINYQDSYNFKIIKKFLKKYTISKEKFDISFKNFESFDQVREYIERVCKELNKNVPLLDLTHVSIAFWNYYRELNFKSIVLKYFFKIDS